MFAGAAAAGPENVHEGEWEITTQVSIAGMPFQPKPVTRTQCVTAKDPVPHPADDQGKCEISTVKAGKTTTWHIKCDKGPNQKIEGDGEITYSGDSMEGKATLTMQTPRKPEPIQATQTVKGRRLGDCKK
jgi:hypothetical protein